jgi:hypothetical protein
LKILRKEEMLMADFTGSILEIEGRTATVMTDQCDFKIIKRSSGMFIGQQICFKKSDIYYLRKGYTKYLSIAASICVIVFSYFLYYQLYMPSRVFAYIDVDINPSVEFTVNKDNLVLAAKPLNEDAKTVLSDGKLDKLSVADAIEKLIKKCEEKGFIKSENDTEILVSGSTDSDRNKSRLDSVLSEIDSRIAHDNAKINTEVVNVNPQERALAVENNMSMGRYALFNKIKEEDNSITVEQAKSSKVSEIIDKARGKAHGKTGTDKKGAEPAVNKPEETKGTNTGSKDESVKNENIHGSAGAPTQNSEDKKPDNSDKYDDKKETDEKGKPKNNSENKGNGVKGDSRNTIGAAVTPTPSAGDGTQKDNSNGSKKNGSGNTIDTQEDNVNEDNHTDGQATEKKNSDTQNERGSPGKQSDKDNSNVHTEKNKNGK